VPDACSIQFSEAQGKVCSKTLHEVWVLNPQSWHHDDILLLGNCGVRVPLLTATQGRDEAQWIHEELLP
jgi:hypothetical protein